MVPVLNHEISEGANDPAQVNLYSGSKSHCKNIDHCQALHQIHCGRVLFSCCRVTENTVMICRENPRIQDASSRPAQNKELSY